MPDIIDTENDPAYVCRECGEAFLPDNAADWKELRRIHKTECSATGGFRRTTVGEAF